MVPHYAIRKAEAHPHGTTRVCPPATGSLPCDSGYLRRRPPPGPLARGPTAPTRRAARGGRERLDSRGCAASGAARRRSASRDHPLAGILLARYRRAPASGGGSGVLPPSAQPYRTAHAHSVSQHWHRPVPHRVAPADRFHAFGVDDDACPLPFLPNPRAYRADDDPRPRILPVLDYSILFPVEVPLNERYRIPSGERRRSESRCSHHTAVQRGVIETKQQASV